MPSQSLWRLTTRSRTLAESTDVSLSLAGIDGDAASVSVEISDGTNTVNADATNDGSGWVVADQDLSGLADGALTVSATVTDRRVTAPMCLPRSSSTRSWSHR